MIAFLAGTALIARMHLVRLLLSRRLLACAALASLPPLATLAFASQARRMGPALVAAQIGWKLELLVVVPLVALIAGSSVVAEEIEDRTITYLFTRPVPRPALLFGRFLATLAVLVPIFVLTTWCVLLAAGRATGKGGPVAPDLYEPLFAAVIAGLVVYTAVFAAFGAFFKHPMIVGLGYAFAIEGFLSNLPGKNQALTIQYYLRSLLADRGSEALKRIEGFQATVFETSTTSWWTLATILVLVLMLGAWRLQTKEYELTS